VAEAVVAAFLVMAVTVDLGRLFPRIKVEAEKRATEYLLRPVHIGKLSASIVPGMFGRCSASVMSSRVAVTIALGASARSE